MGYVQGDDGGMFRMTGRWVQLDGPIETISSSIKICAATWCCPLTQNLRLRVTQRFAQSLQTPLDAVGLQPHG